MPIALAIGRVVISAQPIEITNLFILTDIFWVRRVVAVRLISWKQFAR